MVAKVSGVGAWSEFNSGMANIVIGRQATSAMIIEARMIRVI